MAGNVVINLLNFAGGLFGSVPLGDIDPVGAQKPQFEKCTGPVVTLFAGIDPGGRALDMKGHIPSVTLYDEQGRYLGHNHYAKVKAVGQFDVGFYPVLMKEGNHIDICVPTPYGSQRATYIALGADHNNIDAICLAALMVTQVDGHVDIITGDMASACGYAYSPSNTKVGSQTPATCMWLDGNYDGDMFMQGLSFHLRDFEASEARVEQYNNDKSVMCNSEPRMHRHHDFDWESHIRVFDPPLKYLRSEGYVDRDMEAVWNEKHWSYSTDVIRSRSLHERVTEPFGSISKAIAKRFAAAPTASFQSRFDGTVIVSNNTDHSAVSLCNNPESRGPDFVSLPEQIHCDMTTRLMVPVCSSANDSADECYDLDQQKVIKGDLASKLVRAVADTPENGTAGTSVSKAKAAPAIPVCLRGLPMPGLKPKPVDVPADDCYDIQGGDIQKGGGPPHEVAKRADESAGSDTAGSVVTVKQYQVVKHY